MATPSPQPPLFPLLFAAAPIGVFDSGIGGLSVLRALRAQLPHERFVYFADSAHAPYGERGEAFVLQRSLHIAAQLQAQHHIKALVVACNTATAAAVRTLRSKAPDLPLVGMEPAIKPAAALTQTGRVGVVATRGTIESDKLARLIALHGGSAQFVCQACPGLAKAIEFLPESGDMAQVQELIADNLAQMGAFGHQAGQIDTLVLGCTHYPLVAAQFAAALPSGIRLLETGQAVAQQTANLLAQRQLLAPRAAAPDPHALTLLTSAEAAHIHQAAAYWHIA
ncbi:MAG: glutamate racemase [Brachymonas sp.]